jgi:hypothetical protein
VKNNAASNGRGVESFLARHGQNVIGVLSGFDRLRLQGTLRTLYRPDGMARFLQRVGEPWKNFKAYVCEVTGCIRSKAEDWAKSHGCQSLYLRSSSVRKEELARAIISREKIRQGPVAMMSAVEPCRTWVARGNRESKHLELKLESGKCIHLYFYILDPEKGLLHLRLQSWFPFLTQVCLNGREWLACQMRAQGMRFAKSGNCFTSIEDLSAAQALLEQQATYDWSGWLNGLVSQCHPMHAQIVAPLGISYYWSAAQSEYATDLMFSSTQSLATLYERVIGYAITHFASEKVLRFLGRCSVESYQGEVTSEIRARSEGVRIKHCRDANSIKLYDKAGQVLRVETTINDPNAFRVFRAKEGHQEGEKSWRVLRKSVADLPRRAEVSRAANQRYLQGLASTPTGDSLGEVLVPLCKPAEAQGRRTRALNPWSEHDLQLLESVNRGEFALRGFRNRDLRQLLYPPTREPKLQRRRSAAITRKLALLRTHGLVRKIPHTHCYQLTTKGHRAINALITARDTIVEDLLKIAA